jgi:hypothetical protein
MATKPRVFIGSSTEGKPVAQYLHGQINDVADVNAWYDLYAFPPGTTALAQLVELVNSVDYAVMVFSPDDSLQHRQAEYMSVRDNVLIEYGMCVGRLGPNRVFVLTPQQLPGVPLKRPSDLEGLTVVNYVGPTPDINAILKIKAALKTIPPATHESRVGIGNVGSGKWLDVKDWKLTEGAIIHQWEWHGGENQQWVLVVESENDYRIRSVYTRQYLTVGEGQEAGVIQQRPLSDTSLQVWTVAPWQGSPTGHQLCNKGTSQFLTAAEPADDAGVRANDWLGRASQKWLFRSVL